MKGYFITEAQMQDLIRRLELVKLRESDALPQGHGKRFVVDDIFRAMNFSIHEWIAVVSRDS